MTIIAMLSWSLTVKCPMCGTAANLEQPPYNDDPLITTAIFNNDWQKLHGYEIECGHCQHEFKIDEVEY